MVSAPQRISVLLNPRSGGGRAREAFRIAEPILREAGASLSVLETGRPGEAGKAAASTGPGECDVLCAVGGDGTMHEVINGLMRRPAAERVPVGLIAGGSGNSLLHDLECLDPAEAARRIAGGAARPLDLARVDGPGGTLYSFSVVGWGVAGKVARLAERLRPLGPARYALAAVVEGMRRRARAVRLELDGETLVGRFLMVLACNTMHTGTGMCVAPDARTDDGLLDLMLVRDVARLRRPALLRRALRGEWTPPPHVEYRQVRTLELVPRSDEPLNVDGEATGRTPVRIELLPGAVTLAA